MSIPHYARNAHLARKTDEIYNPIARFLSISVHLKVKDFAVGDCVIVI